MLRQLLRFLLIKWQHMNILEPTVSVLRWKVILQCFKRNLITVSEYISLYMYTCLYGVVQTIVYFRNWKISLPSVSMNCPTAFCCVISKHCRVVHSKMRKFITFGSHYIMSSFVTKIFFFQKFSLTGIWIQFVTWYIYCLTSSYINTDLSSMFSVFTPGFV